MNARKIILSIVIVVMCLFATSMNVSAVDNTAVAEQQVKEKVPMPTNLQWTEEWSAQWTVTPEEKSYNKYELELYMNGESLNHTFSVIQEPNSAIQVVDFIAPSLEISGDYQFRVRAVPANEDLYEPSDWTELSPVRTYVRPANVLPAPSGLYWDINQPGVIHFKAVEGCEKYDIEGPFGGFTTGAQIDANGICSIYLWYMLKDYDSYSVTIRALSTDIDAVAHSDWSEESPVFVAKGDTAGSIVQENGRFVYYNTDGQKDYDKTGLVNYNDIWYYVEDGEVHPEDTEVHVVYFGGSIFVAYAGTVLTSANGAFNVPNTDLWYFCSNGQVQTNYNDLAMYDGEWFVVENGMININYNGIYDYNGGKFFVAAGQLKRAVTGLQQDPISRNWYYFANGEVQVNYTGLATYDGEWFYIEEGMLAEDFSGKVKYDGKDFNVVNGMVKG